MSGTMGNFYVGVSGLQSSQYALNVTAHNITNAGTPGFSRQQIILSDVAYTNLGDTAVGRNQAGLGTKIADVRLVRDTFIDRAIRSEKGREQFYQSKYDVVTEVQNFFGEMEGSDFRSYMMNLWTSAQELQKESNSIVTRSSYIANAVAFVDQANEIYRELTTYQKNLDTQIKDQVKRINELADEIYDLNEKIMKVEAAGVESANDYRDRRDAALDELSGLISIDYKEVSSGQVDVYVENRTLVSMDRTFKMGTKAVSDSCDYLVPMWEDDNENVFSLYNVPTPELKTDVGSLKGLIMSRGDWVPTYTDVPVAPEAPAIPNKADYATTAEYDAAKAQYQLDYAQYKLDYEVFAEKREMYNRQLEPYTVSNIIAQFDYLIHGIVTKINDILCPNKEVTIQTGDTDPVTGDPILKTIKVFDEEKAGYGMGEANQLRGVELFTRRVTPRYSGDVNDPNAKTTVTLADGTQASYYIYNEEDTRDYYSMETEGPKDYLSLYTLGNISVNDELIKNPSLLPLSNLQNEELQEVADQLIKVWQEDFATIGPNSLVVHDFMGYYKEFVGDFANKGKTYDGIVTSQSQAVLELDNQRQTVVGVSTDEELGNLIKFQQGYNASSRYFTVVSEMVEHLINKLG